MSIRFAISNRRRKGCLPSAWSMRLLTIAAVLLAASLAEAQAPRQNQPAAGAAGDPVTRLRAAHQRSRNAETPGQLTAIIEECEEAISAPGISDNWIAYGQKLQSWALNKRGLLRDQEGQFDAALADFDRAIQLDPSRWQAWHNRGVSYARLGRFEDAISDFDRTVRLNPQYTNAYFNRGELRYELGQFDEALKDYGEAIRLQPRDAAAYNSRGHTYYRMGDYQAAINDYARAIRIDPQSAAAYTNRGDAYADLGYYREAANDYRAAIRIDSNLGRAYQSAAWLMATCPEESYRNAERAVQAARKAIELDGDDDYRYLDTLAAALANAGQFDEAAEIQAKVIELAPDETVERYRERLALYEQKSPYRDVLPQATGSGDTGSRARRS